MALPRWLADLVGTFSDFFAISGAEFRHTTNAPEETTTLTNLSGNGGVPQLSLYARQDTGFWAFYLHEQGTLDGLVGTSTGLLDWNGDTIWHAGNLLNIGTSAGSARTAMALGTAATVNTGSSGATIPLLNGNNTASGTWSWSGTHTYNNVRNHLAYSGSGYSGAPDQSTYGFLLTSGAMDVTSKYTPGYFFGSTDPDLTTANPKTLAGVNGFATQTYNTDTGSGMGLEFWGSGNSSGTSPALTSLGTWTISGGLVPATPIALANGGTGGTSATTARTNLGLSDGIYTPTLTGVANVAAVTAGSGMYSRVGGTVTVSVLMNVDPTAANVTTLVGISLPISSNLTGSGQLIGTGTAIQAWGTVRADTANDRAELQFKTADIANRTWCCTFQYRVV